MSDAAGLPNPSITDLGSQIAAGALSAEALVERCLSRIASLNPSLNAFITVLDEAARKEARQLDSERRAGRSRGPLHGIPISIKDLIDVERTPTTAASRVRAGQIASADAPVVARLREAGAVIVGKCNLHEFALGTTSDESAFGPCRHPLDQRRSPGGSSGGSAIAVFTGMSVASIGTDTGGSIRIPAAACGVVGLKPAFGEISTVGVVPLSPSLDHVGPLTNSVADLWLVYQAMRGTASPLQDDSALAGTRLAIPGPYFLDLLDGEVRNRFTEAAERLRRAGVVIEEVTLPHAADTPTIYLHIALSEAAAYHAKSLDRTPEAYSPGVRERLERGRQILAEDYVRAQRDRARLRAEVEASLESYEALLLPALAIPAPLIGAHSVKIDSREEPLRPLMLRLTQLFNLTGHPAISLPCGWTSEGLPCGLQLVGRHQRTRELLRLALACESQVTPPNPRRVSSR